MFTKYRIFITILVLFICALGVRMLFIISLGGENRIYDSIYDQYIYIDLGENIAAGHGLSLTHPVFMADAFTPTSIKPPGYPVFLSGIFYLFGESYFAIRITQAIISAMTCVLIYLITGKLLGDQIALLAAAIVCLYPPLVIYTRPILAETLYTFCFVLLLWLFIKCMLEKAPIRYFAWLGILFGLTFLIRLEVTMFAVMAVVFAIWWNRKHKHYQARELFSGIAVATLAFALSITPWVIRNSYVHGELVVFPSKKWNFWEANAERYMREQSPDFQPPDCSKVADGSWCPVPNFKNLSELERDRAMSKLATDFILQHPSIFVRYGVSRVLISYPIVPREEMPPPIGYKGTRERPHDQYDSTAVDDVPFYFTTAEKLRVWPFRLMLVLTVIGLALAVKQQHGVILLLTLPIFFNIASAFLLDGKERYRIPFDPYLIIIAAYALVSLAWAIRRLLIRERINLADQQIEQESA